jgi:hypothetical protein
MHVGRQSNVPPCCNSNANERRIEKKAGQGFEVLGLSLNGGGMQRRVRVASGYRSNLAPLPLEMGIARTENNARPETVKSLITSKCLMPRIVNEDQEIVSVRFQVFVGGRLHRSNSFHFVYEAPITASPPAAPAP